LHPVFGKLAFFQYDTLKGGFMEGAADIIVPPGNLRFEDVILLFDKYFEPPDNPELVPFYHFKIAALSPLKNPEQVGRLNFRVGNTRHIEQTAGHIGYFVSVEHRGRAYAYKACMALAPFARRFFDSVIITAEIDAEPSIRTILKLGAEFVDEADVPDDDPAYINGARRKKRFVWKLR
jgi:tagatose 1,6-diphosphate aldolase